MQSNIDHFMPTLQDVHNSYFMKNWSRNVSRQFFSRYTTLTVLRTVQEMFNCVTKDYCNFGVICENLNFATFSEYKSMDIKTL